jgi:L-fuconolactonase
MTSLYPHGLRRRDLLAIGGVTAAAVGNCADYSGAIIDTHVHFYDPGRPQGIPWPPKNDALLYRRTLPTEFRQATAGQGITGVIIVEASAWLEDNQWVLDIAKDDPLVVGIVGRLEPGKKEFRNHLVRFTKNPLFRGIRLGGNPIAAGLSSPDWTDDIRRLADAGLQLDAIGNESLFADLLRLSDRIPSLRIVIDHLPFYPPAVSGAMRELTKRPQIYAKVSGVLRDVDGRVPSDSGAYKESLDELWDVFGKDRVIYASNWPVSNRMALYPVVLKVVKEYFTAKGQDAAERYFWRNSLAAYKWIKRK